jgi:hypothetical protein
MLSLACFSAAVIQSILRAAASPAHQWGMRNKAASAFKVGLASLTTLTLLTNPAPASAHEGYGRHQPQLRWLSTGSAPGPSNARSQELHPEFALGTPGVCRLYNLSGYLALHADGAMVSLEQYCQQQRNWLWHETDELWERFRDVATEATLAFAQTLDQDRVEVYAQSICPFLEAGGTLQALAEMQSDQQLPADFDRAITIAAVHTYCDHYRSALRDGET